jgi:general secretion pathway protein L
MMLTRLILLSPQREQPSSYLIVDGAGAIVGRGVLSHRSPSVFKGRTVLIVPGTEIVTRWLDLEDGPPTSVAEAASVLLKDHIGSSRDTIHLALGEPENDGARPVSVVDRLLMQTFIDRAAELGVTPDIVIPDHLMLSPTEDGVLAMAFDGAVAVRGNRLAFSAEDELASLLIGAHRRTTIEDASEIEDYLAGSSERLPMNLLQGDFAAGGRSRAAWGGYRRVAALATVAVLSPLVIWAIEIARNEASARALETRAAASARALVGNTQAGDPIRELRGRLAGLRANDRFMWTTAALFDAVSRAKDVELEGLSYIQDGIIRATLVHTASSDVAAVRAALEQSGVTVDEDAPEQRDSRMLTIITLGRLS